ncbi:MAG: hypothetical protein C4320_03310, partial [Armatimonadota bacterium]
MEDDAAHPNPTQEEGGLDPAAIVDDPVAEITPGDPDHAPGAPHATPSREGGARLVVKRSGAETDEIFPIAGSATIGRFDPAVGPIDVDLAPLPEGAYVSRRHAKLTESETGWSVADLGSSNGTFLLRNGDFERI